MNNTNEKATAVAQISAMSAGNQQVYYMSDGSRQAVFTTGGKQRSIDAAGGVQLYKWCDGVLSNAAPYTVGVTSGDAGNCVSRLYVQMEMPNLPRNPRIKNAELKLWQSIGVKNTAAKLGLYAVTEALAEGEATPAYEEKLIDYALVKTEENSCYTFDITNILDAVNRGEAASRNLVLKLLDETVNSENCVTLYGTDGGEYAPAVSITYDSSYGINTSYRSHTHELGRFGQGSIDLACGNLMFECEDFAWAGNRKSVTLKHLYNSALAGWQYTNNPAIKLETADFSAMELGHGWKLNVMQSMMAAEFVYEGVLTQGFVYIGENGDEQYFKCSDETAVGEDGSVYNLYEDVDGGDMRYDPVKHVLTQGAENYRFDENDRLVCVTDEHGNHMDITYTDERITSVTDGAGRIFGFAYGANGYLTGIAAPDGTSIDYTYEDGLLTAVAYPDGRSAQITYTDSKPAAVTILDGDGNTVYKTVYTFTGELLTGVTEYGMEDVEATQGQRTTYDYSAAARRTVMQTTEPLDKSAGQIANNVIKTVYAFDEEGGVASEYMNTRSFGNTGVDGEGGSIHPFATDSAGVSYISNNELTDHGFDTLDSWDAMSGNSDSFQFSSVTDEARALFGGNVLHLCSEDGGCAENGIKQMSMSIPAGQHTFSAYVRVLSDFTGGDAPGVYLRVKKGTTLLGVSERLWAADGEYVRLEVPFTTNSVGMVVVQILADGAGEAYVDGAQLESNPCANAYNLLENGSFDRLLDGWPGSLDVATSSETVFNAGSSLEVIGSLDKGGLVQQTVKVRKAVSERETFTLSGWAKACALPDRERDGAEAPVFRLRALLTYVNGGSETFTADFCPCTEEWQFASVQFSKSKYKAVKILYVFCEYNYNSGTAYFDDIQLVRNSLETGLSAEDFITESEDVEEDDSVITTDDAIPVFAELLDSYGNTLTETTFTDGEFGTIYRAFGFNANGEENDGNDLILETDARGGNTAYAVDPDTSRNTEVTDRCGNKTAYEYDEAGRTTKVTGKAADGSQIADVSYGYDSFDNLCAITRGDGMGYALAYNAFHNLESIGVSGMEAPLVTYAYKNGNGKLKQVTYANGDTMKATYNAIGQMVSEKWYDAAGNQTADYRYLYDGQGNIVRSIDFLKKKEYSYTYEDGRIVRATECEGTIGGGSTIVTVASKKPVNTLRYSYDNEGKLTKKRIICADGSERVICFENPEDGNTVVKFTAGGKDITSHSKTDSFGRKVFDELQLGSGFVSRQFAYHAGQVTDAHKDSDKLKSAATTQLVSQIVLSDGRTLSYAYDAEERITAVTESREVNGETVTTTTFYTYDALGQLLTESVDGVVINEMTYDGYGNILTKNGKAYTYGDTVWKDKLTAFDGAEIAYDAQGNPATYLGHSLTWEKGRQLKSFDANTYTYNANGIRTSKTVGGITHSYILDGTNILKETWAGNTLIPLYDNEDAVCGIEYNGTAYYFLKNLQGDVIAITDGNGDVVANYCYDAWGVCTVLSDISDCNIATINPYRYRGYYFDPEIGLYYVSSRYYDPVVGRFLNSDDPMFLGASGIVLGNNLFAYCENKPVNMIDMAGFAAINVIFAAVGAVVGWLLGDFVAKRLGYYSGWKYWAIRSGVVIGSAVIGWFAGSLMTKIIATYLKNNPSVVFKITNKLGAKGFHSSMKLLGINPFSLVSNSSKFIAIARLFNTKAITISYDWAVKLYNKARSYGFRIILDRPHNGYTWHIHISGGNGKLNNLHIQIVKKAWDYLSRLLR